MSFLASFREHPFSRFFGRQITLLAPYVVATLSVLVGLQISWLVQPYLSISPPFMVFLGAIMVTAWHGGFRPALFATLLSALIFDYYFMARRYRFAAAPADLATLIFFIFQGALTAYCIVYLQRARHTAVQGQQQLSRLHELSARLFEEKDFDKVLRKVLSAAMELLKSEKSFIQLYDEHTRMLSAIAQVGFTPDFLYQFDRVPIDFSSCGAAVQRKQRVIIGNIALDPEFSQLTPVFSRFGVVAVQSTPLFNTNGQVLGVLSTYFSMPHVSSTEDLRFLDMYAHQAERVLEAKRTEEALRGTNRDLERRAIKNSQQLIEKDKRLRDLFVELVGTEERERRHLAEELHDYLAQLLTFARIKLRQAQQCLHGPVGDSDRHLSETDDALKKSIDYARTLM